MPRNLPLIKRMRLFEDPLCWMRVNFRGHPLRLRCCTTSTNLQEESSDKSKAEGEKKSIFIRDSCSVFSHCSYLLWGGGENEFLDSTVFVLSCFVGYMVVWNVTPSLHTPLMSVTNAISGIIVIGGMLFVSGSNPWIAGVAIFVATINIAGGSS